MGPPPRRPGRDGKVAWPADGLGDLISFGLSMFLGWLNLLSLIPGEVVPNRSLFDFGSEIDCLGVPSCLFEVGGLRRSSLRNCLSVLRSGLGDREVLGFLIDGMFESPIRSRLRPKIDEAPLLASVE